MSHLSPASYTQVPIAAADQGAAVDGMQYVRNAPAAGVPAYAGLCRGVADLSRPQFRNGLATKVGELLRAIPWVRGAPVTGNLTVGQTNPDLFVNVQSPSGNPATAATFYDLTNTVPDTSVQIAGQVQFRVARIGGRFRVPKIDIAASAAGTSQDFADWQAAVAAASLLRQLDTALARGSLPTGATSMSGLASMLSLAVPAPSILFSGNLDADLRQLMIKVTPSGGGVGEGPDCLIAGPNGLAKIMSTYGGQSGASGWRMDPRIGRPVFHYLGLPVYRTDVDEGTLANTNIYCANLGPTGLQLVYVYGTPETFGLDVEITSSAAAAGQTGLAEITVHGAFGLVLWEPNGLAAVTSVNLNSV